MNEQYYYTPNFNNSQNDYMKKQIERDAIARRQKSELRKSVLFRLGNYFVLGISSYSINRYVKSNLGKRKYRI